MTVQKRHVCGMGAVFILVSFLLIGTVSKVTDASQATMAKPTKWILIDPGHGGQDGGASTVDGAHEDDINLAVSGMLYDMLTVCGYPVRMTRTEDTSIQHTDDPSGRSWKTNDMYNRLEMYDAAALTVSIHQNHFSQSKYSGTQLFYSPNTPQSRDIADCIRQTVVSFLQPENKRELKAAGDSIFLLSRTTRPAVIVECGFLSNPAEAAQMQDAVYQQQMAFSVCCGILKYAPEMSGENSG